MKINRQFGYRGLPIEVPGDDGSLGHLMEGATFRDVLLLVCEFKDGRPFIQCADRMPATVYNAFFNEQSNGDHIQNKEPEAA
jgi:hypothetical protein